MDPAGPVVSHCSNGGRGVQGGGTGGLLLRRRRRRRLREHV